MGARSKCLPWGPPCGLIQPHLWVRQNDQQMFCGGKVPAFYKTIAQKYIRYIHDAVSRVSVSHHMCEYIYFLCCIKRSVVTNRPAARGDLDQVSVLCKHLQSFKEIQQLKTLQETIHVIFSMVSPLFTHTSSFSPLAPDQ